MSRIETLAILNLCMGLGLHTSRDSDHCWHPGERVDVCVLFKGFKLREYDNLPDSARFIP